MSVLIAHASLDENRNIRGGLAGDQTGKEVCVRSWYNKPWNVLIRFTDSKKAEKVAYFMEKACENQFVGYDQYQRNTLLKYARKFNYDVSKVTEPCETDCSALVSVACMFAGIPESVLTLNGNCATTRTLKNLLKSTGQVEIYTSAPYVSQTDRLKRGDILLSEGHHVCVVVKVNELKTIEEIAKEVIAGKWGSGAVRRANLTDAGYNYAMVQAKVNELLKANLNKDPVKYIWDFLYTRIGNKYGVAGLMGNMKAESNLNPKNVQNSFEKKLGLNDNTYTAAVDSGKYNNFANDGVGYGLCQWTYRTRKKALQDFKGNRSIGDLDMQLGFLWSELTSSYKNVLAVLQSSKSVKEASDAVLVGFEKPKVQSDNVKEYRASLGKQFYENYGGK